MKIVKILLKMFMKVCCYMNKFKMMGILVGIVKILFIYDKVVESVFIWGYLIVLFLFSLFVNKNKCFGGYWGLCF